MTSSKTRRSKIQVLLKHVLRLFVGAVVLSFIIATVGLIPALAVPFFIFIAYLLGAVLWPLED